MKGAGEERGEAAGTVEEANEKYRHMEKSGKGK